MEIEIPKYTPIVTNELWIRDEHSTSTLLRITRHTPPSEAQVWAIFDAIQIILKRKWVK